MHKDTFSLCVLVASLFCRNVWHVRCYGDTTAAVVPRLGGDEGADIGVTFVAAIVAFARHLS